MTVYDAINQIKAQGGQALTTAPVASSADSGDKAAFSRILADVLGTDSAQQNGETADISTPVSAPSAPTAVLPYTVGNINELLSLLEEYQNALGDSSVSLKDMEPLVSSMEKASQELQNQKGEIEDGELLNLAELATTQATVESIKFRRGDYI